MRRAPICEASCASDSVIEPTPLNKTFMMVSSSLRGMRMSSRASAEPCVSALIMMLRYVSLC